MNCQPETRLQRCSVGIQSLLGRDEDAATFRALLNLKIIRSATATLGIIWSQLEGGPPLGWTFAAVFAAFNALWVRYRFAPAMKSDGAQLGPLRRQGERYRDGFSGPLAGLGGK
jgi:hypothetical protein